MLAFASELSVEDLEREDITVDRNLPFQELEGG